MSNEVQKVDASPGPSYAMLCSIVKQKIRYRMTSWCDEMGEKWTYIGVIVVLVLLRMVIEMDCDELPKLPPTTKGVSLDWPHVRTKKTGVTTTKNEAAPDNVKQLPKNEAAPVSAGQLTEAMTLEYINRFRETAQKEMNIYGIPASISLAQGIVESRAGNSKLALNNNNHFGIKCFSRRCRKGHCSNFTDDSHKDFFRKFKSPWESWREHSVMLSKGRYQNLKKHGRDYCKWAYGLKSVGYATDPNYAEKLIGMIKLYDLDQYDR